MKNVAEIIALLPKLTRNELTAVGEAVGNLLGPQAVANQQAATPLWVAIKRALGLQQGLPPPASRAHKLFKQGEQAVETFMAEYFPNLTDDVTKQAMLQLIIDCLIDDLKSRQFPVNNLTVIQNLVRAPEAFHNSFPGYIKGGASYLIVNHLKGNKNEPV